MDRYGRNGFLLGWFECRFAVLDRDFDEIIRAHLSDGMVAAQHEAVSKAFEEIGEYDLAIEWAENAALFDYGHQAHAAAKRWQALITKHRKEELGDTACVVFERWPNADNASALVKLAGRQTIGRIQEVLETNPDEKVLFQLGVMDDPRSAWDTAHRFDVQRSDVWSSLARAYFDINPEAAIRVELELVVNQLTQAKTRVYPRVAQELKEMRTRARRLGKSGVNALRVIDEEIAALRAKYERRPKLIEALDRAQLP